MKLKRKTHAKRDSLPASQPAAPPASARGGGTDLVRESPSAREGNAPARRNREEQIRQNVERHKRRHKKNYLLYYILLALLLLVVGATLSLTVFFRTDQIIVVGNGPLSAAQLIEDSGLNTGGNLLLTNTERAARAVVDKNVNIDSAVVSRQFPNTIEIRVEPSRIAAVVKSGDKYYSLSQGNRIIRIAGQNGDPDALEVFGCDFSAEFLGDYVEPMPQNKLQTLLAVVDALEQDELTKLVRCADLTSITTIKLYYNDKVEIWMGGITNLGYELSKIKELFDKKIVDNDAFGRLDATVSGKYYYLPLDSLELPDQSVEDRNALPPDVPEVIIDTPPDEPVPGGEAESGD